jgi:D-glycero-beta-D-manno-heptose 1-phosphate adenylyltransferase
MKTHKDTDFMGKVLDKIQPLQSLKEVRRFLRRQGKKVVFTNGCFDILHLGHVRYLEAAAELGDYLIVAVNSDSSVRSIKSPGRPINSQTNRAEVVAALGFVDAVTIFEQDSPLELIRALEPDVLVKGADWALADIVGREEVENSGGRVVRISLVQGFSTTALIEKIRSS